MSYKNPRITVDGIVRDDQTILLVKRKNQPFQGKWALPGGFVEYGEKTEDAAIREVFEETGLKTTVQRLVGVYSDPKRDPRGHTITVAYLLVCTSGALKGGDDAMDAKFFNIDCLPELAFDHEKIIMDAMRKS